MIFDLFDTLVPFSERMWDDLADEMARLLLPSEPERFVRAWGERTAARMTGELEAVIREVCATLTPATPATPGPAIAAALRLNRARHAAWLAQPRPDAPAVLAALRRRGIRTGLISNCSSSVPGSWPASPLGALIDVAVFSSAEGVEKPDPRIYTRTLERLGLAAAECVYVDDSARALDGAVAVGLHAIQFLPPGVPAGSWTGPTVTSLTRVLDLAQGFHV